MTKYTPYAITLILAFVFGLVGWQVRAEFQAWQNTKAVLPQIIQLLNAHEAVLKTQPAATAASPPANGVRD